MKKKKEISIRDIAREAGCSTATVSRILNHKGGYSEPLRLKVQELVEWYGYTTGTAAGRTIGILVPDLRNAFMAEEIVALEELLAREGYHAFVCSTNEDRKREEFCFQGMAQVKASALISFQANEHLARLAAKASFPVIFMDRTPQNSQDFITVESDNYLGGYMAAELLLKKGCKRIVFLSWGSSLKINESRKRGYLDALRDYGQKIDPALLVELEDDRGAYENARDRIYYMLKQKMKFDGIFATNDARALGALTALQMEGIAVPEQVKVIGFDDSPLCRQCYPALSSVRQDFGALAARTVECLKEQLSCPSRLTDKHVVVPVALVERGTT